MKLVALALVACALAIGASAGTLPLKPDYDCDPSSCKPENNCRCASYEAPLPKDQMPQFILYTHDDGIIPSIVDAVKKTVGNRKNPNGCTIPLTWFTIKYDTEPYCNLVKQLWRDGHEIALHTRDHVRLDPPINAEKEDQIVSVRTWLNESCGIPESDMVGMRNPFLITNPGIRKVQSEAGFLYDSSINEHWTKDGMWPTSKDGGNRLWPYTFDNGIPQICDATGPDGSCTKDEKYRGLWEVPVWVLQTSNYPMDAYAMDPGGNVFELLKINFDAAYNGNRAPVPIYMHMPWMTQSANQKYVQKFMDYVLDKPDQDVWFVTMHQLIDWIRNPIPKDQMKEKFNVGCQAGGAGAVGMKSVESSSADSGSNTAADLPAVEPEAAPQIDEYGWPAPAPSTAPAELPTVPQTVASGAAAGAPSAFAAALLGALALALLL